MKEVHRLDQPEEGLYRIRMVRKGHWVAARIYRRCECSINGEPDDFTESGFSIHERQDTCDRPGTLAVEFDGGHLRIRETSGRDKNWMRETPIERVVLFGERIDEIEYRYLIEDAKWARQYAPDDPAANPFKPIDRDSASPAAPTSRPDLTKIAPLF